MSLVERTEWTPEKDDLLCRMAGDGASPAAMAEALGVSLSAMGTRLSRIGGRPSLSESQQERIVELVGLGWRYSRIAKQVGTTEAVVARHVEEASKAPEPNPAKPVRSRPDWTLRNPERTSAVKNRLSDLNDHLFMQLERMADEDLTVDEIEKEATRARAIVDLADKIIANANLGLQAAKLVAGHGADPTPYLHTIEGRTSKPQVEKLS